MFFPNRTQFRKRLAVTVAKQITIYSNGGAKKTTRCGKLWNLVFINDVSFDDVSNTYCSYNEVMVLPEFS